ncbi:hypothetical protein NMG60_11025628 [Bertholletia excelsa]
MKGEMEEHEIVIVGGGICGLATALALHRKGIRSVVLERSQTLRATGGGIGVMANGWRALDRLGVASKLRLTALPLARRREIEINKGIERVTPNLLDIEIRCLKRTDLINTLADALPSCTLRFGCHVVSVKLDPFTSYPLLQLANGTTILTKVLIGCDGSRSVVADFLNLKATRRCNISGTRGLATYANGHGFPLEFLRMSKNNIFVGRIPVDDKLVHWFVTHPYTMASNDHHPEHIRQLTVQLLDGFPTEIIDMVKGGDSDSLYLDHLWYRAPWDLLFPKFRKGTVTVAGDAMHVMGPFLGQGGSAGLEDAVVLARCISQKLSPSTGMEKLTIKRDDIEKAIDQYVKQRRKRVVLLSTQTYLTGLMMQPLTWIVKLLVIILLAFLFINPYSHIMYDCGPL